jgi:chromosome segregation ATPase
MCYRDSLHTPQSRTNSTGPSSPTNTIESLQARIDLQATQLAIKEGENVRLNGEVACLSREAERLDKEVDRVYGQVKNMNAEIKRLRVHERGMEESSLGEFIHGDD